MKTITIEGQLRTEFGKSATRQLRSQDLVPGVIYGGAKEINFVAPTPAFKGIVYTNEFMLAEIIVDGVSYKTILKDLQFDKVSDALTHIDFLELNEDKPVIATIPLRFVGNSKGVKTGGRLITKVKSLKVKTLPKYLKDFIEVDITELDLNGNIRVEDVKLDNIEVLNSARIPVATVVLTRALKQEQAAEAKEGKKKK
ncbi:50S ribosomal protein L25 [Polluticaenibacter yanchengensis]|uniref:Large ribosomal subunit protein bL25 n=1 Tax=Polluticaenibacter yanchengensis TaxID=3014562 RepID=A0ABT4UJ18_9BACT|nr:50S ribosomal protein L25 [Chitinophagaceae bacterium LY-5]